MHPFVATASVVAPVVGGIMVLTLFFKIANRMSSGPAAVKGIGIEDTLDKTTRVTVYLTNDRTFENVKLIGFTDTSRTKGAFPFELDRMAILEQLDGKRWVISSKLIRMIEIPPDAK